MGQGSLTVLARAPADALGCKFARIVVKTVDTDLVPDSGLTVASRTTTMSGNAIVDACRQLVLELRPTAARLLGEKRAARVTLREGIASVGARTVSFDDVVQAAFIEKRHLMKSGWYAPPRKSWDAARGQGQCYSAYAYATQIALVEVDTLLEEEHAAAQRRGAVLLRVQASTRSRACCCTHCVDRAPQPARLRTMRCSMTFLWSRPWKMRFTKTPGR